MFRLQQLSTATESPRTQWWSLAPWLGVVVLGLLVVGLLVFAWLRNPLDGGTGPKRLGFRLPVLGALRGYAVKSGFASTMAMLIGRGLPLPECLRLTAAATEDPEAAAQVDTMRRRAETGENLAGSLDAGALLSPAMLWFVEVGESGGQPATALADVAELYRQRLDRAVDHVCVMITPLGMVVVGVVVLGFALALLGPMFEFYRSVMGG
jgi:type II secretory pathway component PulF